MHRPLSINSDRQRGQGGLHSNMGVETLRARQSLALTRHTAVTRLLRYLTEQSGPMNASGLLEKQCRFRITQGAISYHPSAGAPNERSPSDPTQLQPTRHYARADYFRNSYGRRAPTLTHCPRSKSAVAGRVLRNRLGQSGRFSFLRAHISKRRLACV